MSFVFTRVSALHVFVYIYIIQNQIHYFIDEESSIKRYHSLSQHKCLKNAEIYSAYFIEIQFIIIFQLNFHFQWGFFIIGNTYYSRSSILLQGLTFRKVIHDLDFSLYYIEQNRNSCRRWSSYEPKVLINAAHSASTFWKKKTFFQWIKLWNFYIIINQKIRLCILTGGTTRSGLYKLNCIW